MKLYSIKIKLIIFILILINRDAISVQIQISLLEVDKVKNYLILDSAQYKTIIPLIEKINEIFEDDKNKIAGLKERVNRGEEPGFFEKIAVKRGRDSRAADIKDLIEEIENGLSDEQKVKFKNVEKPELKSLERKEVFGE